MRVEALQWYFRDGSASSHSELSLILCEVLNYRSKVHPQSNYESTSEMIFPVTYPKWVDKLYQVLAVWSRPNFECKLSFICVLASAIIITV